MILCSVVLSDEFNDVLLSHWISADGLTPFQASLHDVNAVRVQDVFVHAPTQS